MASTNSAKEHIVSVKVVAGSRKERVHEVDLYHLKIWVQTPPEKGKANARVAELVALHYKIAPSNVSLIRGAMSREKQFLLTHI
jgi:uncharacterized protein YggU (UPF0235/DUF167 family)